VFPRGTRPVSKADADSTTPKRRPKGELLWGEESQAGIRDRLQKGKPFSVKTNPGAEYMVIDAGCGKGIGEEDGSGRTKRQFL